MIVLQAIQFPIQCQASAPFCDLALKLDQLLLFTLISFESPLPQHIFQAGQVWVRFCGWVGVLVPLLGAFQVTEDVGLGSVSSITGSPTRVTLKGSRKLPLH